jgi:hypothetical protein
MLGFSKNLQYGGVLLFATVMSTSAKNTDKNVLSDVCSDAFAGI